MMSGRKNKGQVTIFIIIGILIIGVILIFVFLKGGGGDTLDQGDLGPRDFVVSCVKDSVRESILKMMDNGGEIIPSQSIFYNGEEWNYLCFHVDYYQNCYNLHPMLESLLESEIEKDTSVAVQGCFNSMKEEFEARGYSVNFEITNYSVDLLPGYVDVNLMKNVEMSNEAGSLFFNDFGFEIVSPIYDLVRVARLIVNDESQFCNFEYNGFMLLYPEYDIRRIDYSGSKIYRVIDRKSGDEFQFAVRSCAFAPGI